MTLISTKIPLDYLLFKPMTKVEMDAEIVPSLTEYYFNAQTNSVVRRTKKWKNGIFETISQFRQVRWNVDENVEGSSQNLGVVVNYNQHHVSRLFMAYKKCMPKIKVL